MRCHGRLFNKRACVPAPVLPGFMAVLCSSGPAGFHLVRLSTGQAILLSPYKSIEPGSSLGLPIASPPRAHVVWVVLGGVTVTC